MALTISMKAHSFDRFYVMTKFMLPLLGDLKCSNLKHDNTHAYLDNENAQNMEACKYMLDLKTFCKKLNHL